MSALLTPPKRKGKEVRLTVSQEPETLQKQENQYKVDVSNAQVRTLEFDEVEVELNTKTFWVQKDKLAVKAYEPPIISYRRSGESEWFEVADWNLRVDVSGVNWSSLPDKLARHFFEYYSHAQERALSPQEQLVFAKICEQVDYKTFAAELSPKRYMECTLVRKSPEPRLRSSSGKIFRLAPSLVDSLHVFQEGDYFGAEFTFTPANAITAIDSPRLLRVPDAAEIERLLPQRVREVEEAV
jgi:hypothetical protein